MAIAFSLASWNIENLGRRLKHLDPLVDFLIEKNPDVVGIYEVTGKDTFSVVTEKMPNYSFHIT